MPPAEVFGQKEKHKMSSLERLELSALEDMAVRVSDIYAEKFGVTRDAT